MRKKSVLIVLGILFYILNISQVPAFAKEGTEIKVVQTKPEIIGEVISFSPIKNPQFIGLAVGGESEAGYDAYFKISPNVRLEHKQSLDDIKLGEWVGLTYEEATFTDEEGKERIERVVIEIRFVRAPTRQIRVIPEFKESEKEPQVYKSEE
jgi:hypothetical protein